MDVRKNLLDLHYQKNLQYLMTTIVILFTYFIALGIAVVTGQLSAHNRISLIIVGIVSSAVLGVGFTLLFRYHYHLQRIPKEIKQLD